MVSEYSLAYWLFDAITSNGSIFRKFHELKTEKSLQYLSLSVEAGDVSARVLTDIQSEVL